METKKTLRALRRHHLARIRAKYRFVAKRWAGRSYDPGPHNRGWVGGAPPCSREEYLTRTARMLAAHHNCDCGMCKRERYDRTADRREFPLEVEE